MKLAKRSAADFETVRCRVLHGDVIIPKRYRSVIMKLFKTPSVKVKLVGEEFNNWLKQFLHTQSSINLPTIDITRTNYYELLNFLEQGKIHLNNLQNGLLYAQCIYGYYLELFYQTFVIEHLSGRVTQTFKVILKENFGISDTHGCKLRWLGKLWNRYPKIGQLSMTLSQFYSHRQQVDTLFDNYSLLADEWKIETQNNNNNNNNNNNRPNNNNNNNNNENNDNNYTTRTYSATNPFLRDMKRSGPVNMETS
jgi:hypothetical protein